MKRFRLLRSAISAFAGNQSGVTAPIVAILGTVLTGAAGYAIDMGHVAWVQRQLQASADAAALAGALYVATDPNTAKTTATNYSAATGKANPLVGATLTGSPSVTPKCFASIAKPTCIAGTNYNGIQVIETATVPTYFLKIFGLVQFTPSATATASAKGGSGSSSSSGQAMNVMVVLDTTQSMKNADPNCTVMGLSNPTKVQCAQAGALALLQGLSAADSVGFMTFPPVNSAGQSDDTTCSDGGSSNGNGRGNGRGGGSSGASGVLSSSDVLKYSASSASNYSLVGLTNGFTANGNLVATNSAVILAGGGGSGCTGLQAVGGVGTFYGDAIKYAQAALPTGGSGQNVIVLLSDGDANSGYAPAGETTDQCQQAISNAAAATAAGTWVYSVAYGTSSSGCSTDTSNFGGKYNVNQKGVSPCKAMSMIASDSHKYYSDGSGGLGCPAAYGTSADLPTLFSNIAADLTKPRLIPNSTT